jgi:hypothetical protein
MVGAARVTWESAALVSVPAGEFEAVRIDVNITGFADPFPLTLSIFVDPTVGIVRHEAVGSSPGPTRHIRADLTDFEPTN